MGTDLKPVHMVFQNEKVLVYIKKFGKSPAMFNFVWTKGNITYHETVFGYSKAGAIDKLVNRVKELKK